MNRVNSRSGSALLRWQHRKQCRGYYCYYYYTTVVSTVQCNSPSSISYCCRPSYVTNEGTSVNLYQGWTDLMPVTTKERVFLYCPLCVFVFVSVQSLGDFTFWLNLCWAKVRSTLYFSQKVKLFRWAKVLSPKVWSKYVLRPKFSWTLV